MSWSVIGLDLFTFEDNPAVMPKDERIKEFNVAVAGKEAITLVFVLIKLLTEASAVSPAEIKVDELEFTVRMALEETVVVAANDESADLK